MKSLESQISELETEIERISRVLETQKAAASELELDANKKAEDITREVRQKVTFSPFGLFIFIDYIFLPSEHRDRATEIPLEAIRRL